jgi:hypothetical protein
MKSKIRDAALAGGWRSGLEEQVGNQLDSLGIDAQYEPCRLCYTKPETPATYTPDFILPNGIIIETKGRFVTEDRKKHKLLKAQHPALDIRFVFSYPNGKIGKKSKTTYAIWCQQYGFQYAAKFVPRAWLYEPVNLAALAAIQRIMKK